MPSARQIFETEESLDYISANNEFYGETFFDIWTNCVGPSALSVFCTVYKLILVNFCFGVVISTGQVTHKTFHILSGCSGLYLINCLEFTKGKILIAIFLSQSYVLLHLGCAIQKRYDPIQKHNINKVRYLSNSNVVKFSLITILVLCEYFIIEPPIWLEMRGIVMVFAMKIISIAEDMDKGVIKFPTSVEYFGYIFCGANVLFGPWISFHEYIILYNRSTRKNIWWIYGIIRALFVSIFFLMISNCWVNYFITKNSNRWLIGYGEALSFRTSHYFVCYLSEASMLAAGFRNNYKTWHVSNEWRFVVTKPLKVEMPNALSTVVTDWNRPMHVFLKKYIYKSWLPRGKFYAMLITFIVSSFLHGFEMKISVVLITIGMFSYLQFAARDYLAQGFDCCIRVHPCKSKCAHKYKRNSIKCRIILLAFSIFTSFHLMYLGVLMDSSTNKVGIYNKWNNLYFASFWMMSVNALLIM